MKEMKDGGTNMKEKTFFERLSAYTERKADLESALDDLNLQIITVKERIAKIENDDIPTLFHEFGIINAELTDGRKVSLETYYNTKTIDKDKLFAWLKKNGYDAIIAETFSFKKGVDIQQVQEFLEKKKYDFVHAADVHPMTLKATIKHHIEEGNEAPPKDAVEVSIFEKARIKEAPEG